MRTIIVPGVDAYRRVYSGSISEGLPFVIGAPDSVESLLENLELEQRGVDEIVTAALAIDVIDHFDKLWQELLGDATPGQDDFEEIVGEWPKKAIPQGLLLHTNLVTGAPLDQVYLGYAMVPERWMIPAFLKFGGWNDCPPPELHCAIQRFWNEQYGAEIVGVSGDVMECRVKNPPADRESAMALAIQQYGYCTDIVEQGTETIANLAASLMNSQSWYFWWD